jgi:hypothetical protein
MVAAEMISSPQRIFSKVERVWIFSAIMDIRNDRNGQLYKWIKDDRGRMADYFAAKIFIKAFRDEEKISCTILINLNFYCFQRVFLIHNIFI